MKGKVLPGKTVTISPFELCTAVLGFKVSQFIQFQLDIDPKDNTDNNVVLVPQQN